MIVYAAIDIRGGRVVQLVGGDPADERISWPDPEAVAQQWADAGFAALHVVDLDAALGIGENRAVIAKLLQTTDLPVNVGGGVRDDATIQSLLDAGAARVIVGTRGIEQPRWLEQVCAKWPERIVLAADMRDGGVVTRGWTKSEDLTVQNLLTRVESLPLAGVLVTDVGREGQMVGIDEEAFSRIIRASCHPVTAAGGIGGDEDVRTLARIGASGAVLGMALYTGAVDAALAREFAA